MDKRHFAFQIFLTAIPVILQPIKADASEWITKQNQADQECTLSVDVDTRINAEPGIDWIKFSVSIPKDDKRLDWLLSIHFVLGTNGSTWPWRVIIPTKPSETISGSKTFEVNVHRSQLHDSFVEFTCSWSDPKLSSRDVSYLKLETYVEDEEIEPSGRIISLAPVRLELDRVSLSRTSRFALLAMPDKHQGILA